MKKKKRLILFIAGGFIGIPVLFNLFFHSSKKSSFLFVVPSDISVETWFSFWITFLAGIASALVAVIALYISIKTESANASNKRNAEKLLFIPTKLELRNTWDGYRFISYLPQELMALNHTELHNVICEYTDATLTSRSKAHLDACKPYIVIDIDKAMQSVIEAWKCFSIIHSENECKISITLQLQYESLDYLCREHSYCVEVGIWLKYIGNMQIEILSPHAVIFSGSYSQESDGGDV